MASIIFTVKLLLSLEAKIEEDTMNIPEQMVKK